MRAQLTIQIRRASRNDAAAIELLLRESFHEHEHSYTPEAFNLTTPGKDEIENRIQDWTVWVALRTKLIVGTVTAHPEGGALHIRSMAVHPKMRGHGIGKLLLGCVEEFARANGYEQMVLDTTPFLKAAIQLYERFGFAFTGPEQNWFGTPLRTMTKQLNIDPV